VHAPNRFADGFYAAAKWLAMHGPLPHDCIIPLREESSPFSVLTLARSFLNLSRLVVPHFVYWFDLKSSRVLGLIRMFSVGEASGFEASARIQLKGPALSGMA